MGINRNQIEKGNIRKLFPKPKAGQHKYMKKQMNKYIRKNKFNMPIKGKFRPTKGWEF